MSSASISDAGQPSAGNAGPRSNDPDNLHMLANIETLSRGKTLSVLI
jgi:hypothetical protein